MLIKMKVIFRQKLIYVYKMIYLTEAYRNLWKIENFYSESISDLKINHKAEDMQVSEQNMLLKLVLENH